MSVIWAIFFLAIGAVFGFLTAAVIFAGGDDK